jgi:hypothetical protein
VSRIPKLSSKRPEYSGKLEEKRRIRSQFSVGDGHGKFVIEEELEIGL